MSREDNDMENKLYLNEDNIIDGKNEERLYVCFSPISFDGGLYGFKADAKQSLEDNGTRITR